MSEPASLTPDQIALQRRLKWVVVILGMLLLIGFGALIIGMAMTAQKIVTPAAVTATVPPGTFEVPEGMAVVDMTASDNLLVLRLEGGGKTRLILIDPRSGTTRGTLDGRAVSGISPQ